MTREEIKALAAKLAEAGYTAKDLSGMKTFARGGSTDSDSEEGSDEPIDGGEIAPAIVKPAPVEVTLTTYPVSRRYPISHSALNSAAYPSNLARQATPEDFNRHPVHISKSMNDPTYNLVTNNCSDDTGRFLGDALHTTFIDGITTPIGLQRKVVDYLKRNNLPYEQSDPGVYTTIQIPWYDYRKAVDNYNDQMMLRAQEGSTDLHADWYRDQPRLQWHFDANGNVVNGRAAGGFIRRFEDGGYTIQRGDTLSEIARRANVDVADLQAINNIRNADMIRAGDTLTIPKVVREQATPTRKDKAAAGNMDSGGIYTIKAGDNLTNVASRLGTSVDELVKYNNISDPNRVYVGQQLRTSMPTTADSVAAEPVEESEGFLSKVGNWFSGGTRKDKAEETSTQTAETNSAADKSVDLRSLSEKDLRTLQKQLIRQGWLASTRDDKGFKFADGKYGKLTQQAYDNYLKYGKLPAEEQETFRAQQRLPSHGDTKCTSYTRDRIASIFGWDILDRDSIVGNAWTIVGNTAYKGKSVYNIYTDPRFDNIKDEATLKKVTREVVAENPIDYSSMHVGDVVGIFYPNSKKHMEAYREGTTYNTHSGAVVGYDDDGMPLIDHNIHATTHRDRADHLFGGAKVTAVARPRSLVKRRGYTDDMSQNAEEQQSGISGFFDRVGNWIGDKLNLHADGGYIRRLPTSQQTLYANGGFLRSYRTGGETVDGGELAAVHVTPYGNYVEYSSSTSAARPTVRQYMDARAEQQAIQHGVVNMVNKQHPDVPQVPSYYARGLVRYFGIPEDTAIKIFGYEKDPATCTFTATGAFDDPRAQVTGSRNILDTGAYVEVPWNSYKPGMLIVNKTDGLAGHTNVVTGIADNGHPLITYSNGGIDVEGEPTHMRYNKDNLFAPDGHKASLDNTGKHTISTYRYIGSPQMRRTWLDDYYKIFVDGNPYNVGHN